MNKYLPKFAIVVLVAGVAFSNTAHAAGDNAATTDVPSSNSEAMPPDASGNTMMSREGGMKHVDERINTLHDKLNLNKAQEAKWGKVANVMRQNEESVRKQVDARHNMTSATAVDDLKSYERIVSAHEAGLKKLVPVFQSFYNSLSAEQKANADDVFKKYEGRDEDKTGEAVPGNAPDITPAAGNQNSNAPENNYVPSMAAPNSAEPNATPVAPVPPASGGTGANPSPAQ